MTTLKHKERHRVYMKEVWYPKNKAKHIKYVRAQKKKRVARFLEEFKKDAKCSRCSESDTCCLDFHHIDPLTKERRLASIVRDWSWERIEAEVKKCIVLCANCHRKHHCRVEKRTIS